MQPPLVGSCAPGPLRWGVPALERWLADTQWGLHVCEKAETRNNL